MNGWLGIQSIGVSFHSNLTLRGLIEYWMEEPILLFLMRESNFIAESLILIVYDFICCNHQQCLHVLSIKKSPKLYLAIWDNQISIGDDFCWTIYKKENFSLNLAVLHFLDHLVPYLDLYRVHHLKDHLQMLREWHLNQIPYFVLRCNLNVQP